MPDHRPGDPRSADRSDGRDGARRRAEHAGIERLAGDLVRALAARLETTGLGEIEVTEGGGRVRVRRPTPGAVPGSSGPIDGGARGSGRGHAGLVAVGPGSLDGGRSGAGMEPDPGVATSPAVGYFSPRDGIGPGVEVTAGERIGTVDVLGVGHEVSAPMDGVVDEVLIAPGQAVEYGERLVTVEPPGAPAGPAVSEA
jgi:acetyl-CoA carboxylase biotin carboxyl carrier protein